MEHKASDIEPDAYFIEISVEDTGEGISEEIMGKIFQPLFTTKPRGIGLGLAVSRKLVEANGGSIKAESRLGEGSVFTVALPAGAESPPAARYSLGKERSPLRILLAEDNPVNRKIAVGMLERHGHSVVVAGNGKEAVVALEAEGESPFDLVLMDVQMPEMDGLEATSRIREKEKHAGGHIPIIALTAHAMKGDREVCLAAGMDGYVSKPLKYDVLAAAMDEAIGARQAAVVPGPHDRKTTGSIFDRERTMASVDGNMSLFREVVELFSRGYPENMAKIRHAIGEKDACGLDRAAHALKGSVGNFGARSAFDSALRLEMMGKSGDLVGASEAYDVLEREMELLVRALEDFAEGCDEDTDSRG